MFGCNGQFRDYGSGCTLFTVKQNPVHVAGISDGNDGASIARDVFLLHLLHGKPLRAKIIRCGLGQASGNSRQMLGGCDLLVGAISAVLRIFQQMDHAIGNAVIGFPQGGQVHILLHHAGHAHRLVLLVPPSKESISCPDRRGCIDRIPFDNPDRRQQQAARGIKRYPFGIVYDGIIARFAVNLVRKGHQRSVRIPPVPSSSQSAFDVFPQPARTWARCRGLTLSPRWK